MLEVSMQLLCVVLHVIDSMLWYTAMYTLANKEQILNSSDLLTVSSTC